MPMASTRPNRERLFSEKPNSDMKKKVPMSEMGIATLGMIAARQVWRNSRTTITTSTTPSVTAAASARMRRSSSMRRSFSCPSTATRLSTWPTKSSTPASSASISRASGGPCPSSASIRGLTVRSQPACTPR